MNENLIAPLQLSFLLGKVTCLEAIAERESIYKLLAQTTPENTVKDLNAYTVDPHTRYPTLNTKALLPAQVTHLVDTDDPSQLLTEQKQQQQNRVSAVRRKDSTISPDNLLQWLSRQVEVYDNVVISDMTTSFQNGLALCAILHRYRPDLIDFATLDAKEAKDNIQLAFDLYEHELSIHPVMKASELADITKIPDKLTMMSYLSQIYECFKRDIPASKILEGITEDDEVKLNIGQMVAKKASKKRRSKENQMDLLLAGESPLTNNKENVSETARMNRSANRKRLLNLMQRAEASANEKKKKDKNSTQRKSIKEEERFKIIEQQFGGADSAAKSKKMALAQEAISKYRENKKPKELKRAIGKIDKDDWYIKNIEEKLVINTTKTPEVKKDKVPKWSKAAFQDKFNTWNENIKKGGKGGKAGSADKADGKYADIDSSLAKLQRKLKEGSALETGERGSNRVSALAEELFAKNAKDEEMSGRGSSVASGGGSSSIAASNTNGNNGTTSRKISGSSETCHFCTKRVYVVERMTAEGKFFHRSCFRCDYCNILLRLGSYVYHREGTPFAGKFFCIPHSTENALEKYR